MVKGQLLKYEREIGEDAEVCNNTSLLLRCMSFKKKLSKLNISSMEKCMQNAKKFIGLRSGKQVFQGTSKR